MKLKKPAMEENNGIQKLAVGVNEAAAMLSVSVRTVQNLIHFKQLPYRKIGRRTVILVKHLEAFLRRDHATGQSNDF
jgi:excisionase family DNA binding protein